MAPAPDRNRILGLTLGTAGLIPFVALSITLIVGARPFGLSEELLAATLVAYGAAILSFLGGILWGLTLRHPTGLSARPELVASVLPPLLAWFALLLDPQLALAVLIAGFIGQGVFDAYTLGPDADLGWFHKLRIWHTVVVIVLLSIGLAGLRG
jgi:hypothetical protein